MRRGLVATDMLSAVFLIALSAVLYFYMIPEYVSESGIGEGAMSPRFFPRLGALIIGIGGISLLAHSVRVGGLAVMKTLATKGGSIMRLAPFGVGISLSVFVYLFEHVGYLVSASTLVATMMVVFGSRSVSQILVATVVVTLSAYAVFNYGLGLPLD